MGKISNIKIAIILGFLFFVFGFFTLKDYGINWDTINHLPRGQAFLQYFLTGKKDYSNLPPYPKKLFQDPTTLAPQTSGRSYYESDETPYEYYIQYGNDGHPPLSDILSAVFNRILYSKLHLVDDIDAYHVYGIFLASILVGLIYYWVSKYYGKISGLIASLSLALYPLFWSESHFNTEKDVPETVYWSFFLFSFWKGITEKKVKWVLISGVFFGLAFGTKLNILFSLFVVAPWLVVYFFINKEKLISGINIKLFVSGIIALIIGFLMFFVSFPNLWPDPIVGITNVINFYKRLGIAGAPFDSRFIILDKINLYPLFWIVTTTSPIILVLLVLAVMYVIKNIRKEKNGLLLLFILWLIVPIARVSWDAANIYGGIRQIMEYLPALCILAGIGGGYLIVKLKLKKWRRVLFIIIILISLLIPIIETHPSENAYFNFLVGGLSGAKAKNIPSWGNTFGAAYRPAVDWINKNVPQGASVTFANELLPNMPIIWVRPDINFSALSRSGYLRQGEYALTLTYQGTDTRSYYDMYLNKFITPVYQSKVDGVAVVTVWKNDDDHLNQKWSEKKISKVKVIKNVTGITFDLNNSYKVSRLEMNYIQKNCSPLAQGVISISNDGIKWKEMPDKLPDSWSIAALGEQPQKGHFIEPFVGDNVRYVRFDMAPKDTCLLKSYTSVSFFYLE